MKRKLNSNAKKIQKAKKLKLNNEPATHSCSSKSSKKSTQSNSELKESCEQLISSENNPRKSVRLCIKQTLRDEEGSDDKLTFAQKLKNKSHIYSKIYDDSNDNEVPLLHNQKVNSPNKFSKSGEIFNASDKRNASVVLERSHTLDKFASNSLISKINKIKLINNLQVNIPRKGNSTMNYNNQLNSLRNYETKSNIPFSNQNILSDIPSTSHDTLLDSSTSHNHQFENYPKSPDNQSDLLSVDYLSEVEDDFQFEDRAPLNMKSESIISLANENKLQNTDDASTLGEFLESHEGIMKTKTNLPISNQRESGGFFDKDINTLELKIEPSNTESINFNNNSELCTMRMDVFGNVVFKDETNEEKIDIFNDVTEEEESCEILNNFLESRQNNLASIPIQSIEINSTDSSACIDMISCIPGRETQSPVKCLIVNEEPMFSDASHLASSCNSCFMPENIISSNSKKETASQPLNLIAKRPTLPPPILSPPLPSHNATSVPNYNKRQPTSQMKICVEALPLDLSVSSSACNSKTSTSNLDPLLPQSSSSDKQENLQSSNEQFMLNELLKLKSLVVKQEKQITALEGMVTKTQKSKKHDSEKDIIIDKRRASSVKFDRYSTLEAKLIKMYEELKHMKEEQNSSMKEMKKNTRELEDRISTKFEALLEQGRKDREILIEFLQEQRKVVRGTEVRKHLCEEESESGKSSSSIEDSIPSPKDSVRDLEINGRKNCCDREDETFENDNSTDDITILAQFIPLDQKMQVEETEVRNHLREEDESGKSSSSVEDSIPSPQCSVRNLEINVRKNCRERDEAIKKENPSDDIAIPAQFIPLDQKIQIGEPEVRNHLCEEENESGKSSSSIEDSISSPQYSVRDVEINVKKNCLQKDETFENENSTDDITIPAQFIPLDQKMQCVSSALNSDNDSIDDSNGASYLQEDLSEEECTDMREMSASKSRIPSRETLSSPLRICVRASSKSSVELEEQNEINILSDKEKTTITLTCVRKEDEIKNQRIKSWKAKSKKKIKRPCYYCGKFQSKLKLHLLNVHKYEPLIKEIKLMNDKEKKSAIKNLRNKGLAKINKIKLKNGESPICIKFQNQFSKKAMCTNCLGIYSRASFYNHSKTCGNKPKGITVGDKIITEDCTEFETYHKDFDSKILARLNLDDVGIKIRKDHLLKVIGNDEFERIKGKKIESQTRKRVSAHMRRICKLFLTFNAELKKRNMEETELLGMFKVGSYQLLKYCIHAVCEKESTELKSGAIRLYDYSVKKAGRAMISYFREINKDQERDDVIQFLNHYKDNSEKIVGESEFLSYSNRCINRSAEKMASKAEIDLLSKYVLSEFQDLVNDNIKWDINKYIRLRRAVVCRLTFFNGRPPAEVGTLSISAWDLAKANAFITEEQFNKLRDEDKSVVNKFRIAYNKRKNYSREVSILIPESCFDALNILANDDIRKEVDISISNKFLFPATNLSKDPVSGFHDIKSICFAANLTKNLCTVQLRHHVSRAFGLLDITEQEKNIFYGHMGHSQTISEDLYQMPKALATIRTVGPFLKDIHERIETLNSHAVEEAAENKNHAVEEGAENQSSLFVEDNKIVDDNDAIPVTPSKSKHMSLVKLTPGKFTPEKSGRSEIFIDNDLSDENEIPSSDDEYIVRPKKRKLNPRNNRNWSNRDKDMLQTFFVEYINGDKKSYPNSTQVDEFLANHPSFLSHIKSPRLKKNKIRTQLNNKRKSINMKKRKRIKEPAL